jgi:glucose-1-phosphate cytidylyltransferase
LTASWPESASLEEANDSNVDGYGLPAASRERRVSQEEGPGLQKKYVGVETMKVVILAGGMGTRIGEESLLKPKPMIEIGERPILWHIMKHYARYGFNEFIIALGYKGEMIKRYFLDYYTSNRDLAVSLADGSVQSLGSNRCESWSVRLIDTGRFTLTGGRLKQLASLIDEDLFMMTYGDGVSDVNLEALLNFHREHRGLVTLTAVRPPARFGALEFEGDRIRHFKEKSTLHEGWINGGFFVMSIEALDYIDEDVMWEHAPMEKLAEDGELYAYRHEGFWQCMDTVRDRQYLESLWKANSAPWKSW